MRPHGTCSGRMQLSAGVSRCKAHSACVTQPTRGGGNADKVHNYHVLVRPILAEPVRVWSSREQCQDPAFRGVIPGQLHYSKGLGCGVFSADGGRIGNTKDGWSPVSVFRKATILVLSSCMNCLPSWKRPMTSTASVRVAARHRPWCPRLAHGRRGDDHPVPIEVQKGRA